MTRTERNHTSYHKSPKNANTAAARQSQISRSLSKLLRHQAENERILISAAGWVKLDDLLAWRGLERIAKGITVAEIFGVVEEDGRVGKGRFGVKYVGEKNDLSEAVGNTDENLPTSDSKMPEGPVDVDGAATGTLVEGTSTLSTTANTTPADTPSKNTPETRLALQHHLLNPSTPPTAYLIRATQGHSIKSIQSTELLTPLTLTTPSLPSTIVHGTFYGAWAPILATGGLKPMDRNNVHFATGPPLHEVTSTTTTNDSSGGSGSATTAHQKAQVDESLSRNKVVSGMRRDAQLLVYIDLARCLEDIQAKGLDMAWWISGNGVVLTEGLVVPARAQDDDDDNDAALAGEAPVDATPIVASRSAKARKYKEYMRRREPERIVPMEYWSVVVEVKHGLGVIWRYGEGVVKELPENLRSVPVPRGKAGGGGGRGRGRGGRPRLNVERGDVNVDDHDDDGGEEV